MKTSQEDTNNPQVGLLLPPLTLVVTKLAKGHAQLWGWAPWMDLGKFARLFA